MQGTPEHPAIAAGTAVWVGRGSELANPFEVYEHCTGPGGDWGVHDVGRFHAPCTHGWTRVGAAKHAVVCFTAEFAKAYPSAGSGQFGLAFWLHCKELVCDCPLDVDGAPYRAMRTSCCASSASWTRPSIPNPHSEA